MMRSAFVIATLSLAAGGCTRQQTLAAQPSPLPFKSVATAKQLMNAIVVPTSNVVFEAAGEAPKDDEGWANVERNAITLAEAGNLLLLPGRLPQDKQSDSVEWRQQSLALMDAAMLAVTAAGTKDTDKMGEAGDAIYAVCESCHQRFNGTPPVTPQ